MNSGNITFRTASASDLEEVARIAKRADPWGWTLEQLKGAIATGDTMLLCIEEGHLIGFSITRQVLDEAELLDIAIDTERQGRGLGKALLSEALKTIKLRGVRTVHLEVRQGNLRAQGLYVKTGFKKTGTRPGYYPASQGREDAVLMRLDM